MTRKGTKHDRVPWARAKDVGARIRAARLAAGMTQLALAGRMDPPSSQTTVTRWEAGGPPRPNWADVERIAKELGVPLSALVPGLARDAPAANEKG